MPRFSHVQVSYTPGLTRSTPAGAERARTSPEVTACHLVLPSTLRVLAASTSLFFHTCSVICQQVATRYPLSLPATYQDGLSALDRLSLTEAMAYVLFSFIFFSIVLGTGKSSTCSVSGATGGADLVHSALSHTRTMDRISSFPIPRCDVFATTDDIYGRC